MIDPGTIIDGRYRVISRLGSGGMADVYLAQDQLLGRDVAVKVLHHHFAEDQEFVERFRREASSAAALSHPNIVAIFDRGEWNGTYYIAMEYVAGRTLKTIVREHGRARPRDRDRDRRADPARGALRPPPRRDPPRSQAAQRDPRRRGPRARHRLRDRARGRVGHDADGLDHGHRAVPLPRAGAGAGRQRRLGPVLDRGDPVRAAHRRRPVRGRDGGRDRLQAGLRRAGAAEHAQPRDPAVARRDRPARARQGPGRALRRRRRADRRARARARAAAGALRRASRRRTRRPRPPRPTASAGGRRLDAARAARHGRVRARGRTAVA